MEEDFAFPDCYQTVRLLTGKDGLPIRLHEDVWGEDGKRWRIVGIGERYVWGQRIEKSVQKRLKPEWLAHEEPDSFERILDDAMAEHPITYCRERGIANESDGIAGFHFAFKADLVRRCENLAGVQHV